MSPPASSNKQIPAATSHSQQPPSHHISKLPIAVYARSIVALPNDLTPCTIPPLPSRPPTSAAMFRKLSTFRCRLPSAMSLLSLPHSHANMHFPGALAGIGLIALPRRGNLVVSFSHAPLPLHAENSWFSNGAKMTPMIGLLLRTRAMLTQNIGKAWVKFTVPSSGSTTQVGPLWMRYSFDEPLEYVSSPRKACFGYLLWIAE